MQQTLKCLKYKNGNIKGGLTLEILDVFESEDQVIANVLHKIENQKFDHLTHSFAH